MNQVSTHVFLIYYYGWWEYPGTERCENENLSLFSIREGRYLYIKGLVYISCTLGINLLELPRLELSFI